MILRLLVSDGAERTGVQSLWTMLDNAGYPMSLDSLKFHLTRVLEPDGYVKLWRVRDVYTKQPPGSQFSPGDVLFAAVLPKGIKLLDGLIRDEAITI